MSLDQTPAPVPPPAPPAPSFVGVFPPIMLPMFLAVVDQTIVATALPAIAASTGEVERASWVVVSYLIAATVAAPIYGRLGDAFGRRKLMFVALAIFVVASALCAFARTIPLLTAARVLQGLGGGGLMTLSQALIGEAIPPRERGRFQGYLAAIAVSANSFGPVAGGYLTEHFGWPSIFLINVPIGLLSMLLALRLAKRTPAPSRWRPDPGGLVLFIVVVASALLGLEAAQKADLHALPSVLGLFALAIVAGVLLVMQEKRAPSPLIPVTLLRQPAIWRSDALAFCHGAALVSLVTFLPIYLEVVRNTTPSQTGLLLVPLTVGIGTGSLLTGRLMTQTGRTTVFPSIGLVLVTANLVALAIFAHALSIAALAWFLLWNGLFMGTVMGVVQVTVQSASGPQRLGEAAASVQFSRSIGAAFGTALVGAVLFATLALRNPDAAQLFAAMVRSVGLASGGPTPAQLAAVQGDVAAAFRAAFMTVAAFTAIGAVLATTIPLKRV